VEAVPGKVGLVFVSHSVKIAEGLVELAAQMAGDTALLAAGGTEDGGIGTSFELVSAAIARADSGSGVVVLCDLGSAILTAETALDFLDDEARERVVVVDAPLVEGGVAAAVAAESGGDRAAVVAAARSALGAAGIRTPAPSPDTSAPQEGYSRSVVIVNNEGLHARPAAEFVKLANTLASPVTVNGRDAKSLLGIMALGLGKGDTIVLATADPAGRPAVDSLAALVESGLGEA
jgi:PTS hybrid protein